MPSEDYCAIWTRDRSECLSDAVRRSDINRLRGLTEDGRAPFVSPEGDPAYGPTLIVPHAKVKGMWFVAAGIDPTVITAELRRKIAKRPPIAQANATVREVNFSNDCGAGTYFELTKQGFNYATTLGCLVERLTRLGEAQPA